MKVLRLLWAFTALLAVIVILQASPARFRELTQVSTQPPYGTFHQKFTISFDSDIVPFQLQPGDESGLKSLGFSTRTYAGYVVTWEAVTIIASFLVGALIFWKKSDDVFGLFSAYAFLLNGFFYVPTSSALVRAGSEWELLAKYMITLGAYGGTMFTLIFPDGRIIPRWARPLAAVYTAWILLMPLSKALNPFNWPFWPYFLFVVTLFSAIGAAQIYRYVRISTPVQRQQTKWFLYGLAIACISFVLFNFDFLGAFFPSLRQPGLPRVVYTLVALPISSLALVMPPLAVFVAILRYKLWEIDLIIRRSIIYASLTFILALIYLACVLVSTTLLEKITGQNLNEIATVISTLLIATLFNPLRGRIQEGIDRRFYRRHYDAERTLQAFSATLRNEVDLDRLSEHLVTLVQETVQPEAVSFWLKKSGPV